MQWSCLAGRDALSLADLLLAPQLSMFALGPEGVAILQDHENLSGWLARIEARLSMTIAQELISIRNAARDPR